MREGDPNANIYIGQMENYKLIPIKESCIEVAERVFKERYKTDTNPVVVQMIQDGIPIDHWYYRSNQWIAQVHLNLFQHIIPFIGPANEAPSSLFGDDKYVVDQQVMDRLLSLIKV